MKGVKNTTEKKTGAAPPEKYFKELKAVYFNFHKENFKDEDGYPLSPNWNGNIIGMESAALKKIITTLREIEEGKRNPWELEDAESKMYSFLKRAHNKPFLRKNFMCVMLNKYKVDILSSSYNPNLVKKILEIWYFEFPGYARDFDKDKAAGEIMVGFLKQQYLVNSLEFEENSVLGVVRLIFQTVKDDEFWCKKSLKSIANNIQEFVNKIKSKNGRNGKKSGTSLRGKPTPTSDAKIQAFSRWGLKDPSTSNDGEKDL